MRLFKNRDSYNTVTELACTKFARRSCHYFKEGTPYSSFATLSANFLYVDTEKKISVQDALDNYYIRKAQKQVEKTVERLNQAKAEETKELPKVTAEQIEQGALPF